MKKTFILAALLLVVSITLIANIIDDEAEYNQIVDATFKKMKVAVLNPKIKALQEVKNKFIGQPEGDLIAFINEGNDLAQRWENQCSCDYEMDIGENGEWEIHGWGEYSDPVDDNDCDGSVDEFSIIMKWTQKQRNNNYFDNTFSVPLAA